MHLLCIDKHLEITIFLAVFVLYTKPLMLLNFEENISIYKATLYIFHLFSHILIRVMYFIWFEIKIRFLLKIKCINKFVWIIFKLFSIISLGYTKFKRQETCVLILILNKKFMKTQKNDFLIYFNFSWLRLMSHKEFHLSKPLL